MIEALSLATVLFLAGISLVLLEGARRRNLPAVANASVSLGASILPLVVGFGTDLGLGPVVDSGLTSWIAFAGLLHSVGMLGPYDSVRWWDVLTHGVSGALVAALVYAAGVVALGPAGSPGPSTAGVVGLTLLLALALGVFWELIELVAREFEARYGIDPVLVHYGWRDTAVDLLVDLAAAAVVVVLDVRAFVPVAARAPGTTRATLLWVAGVAVLGSLVMAVWIRLGVGEAP